MDFKIENHKIYAIFKSFKCFYKQRPQISRLPKPLKITRVNQVLLNENEIIVVR